ncbi:FecR family protein, partial [Raoultella terrigena]|uniref:FecR family protein n=2 Tax=Enterobacterales TaxID=91347 RepID=UPI0035B572F4
AQGRLEALGTRFSVRLLPDHAPPASRLGVEQGAVRMQPRLPGAGVRPVVAEAGQRWLMTRSGLRADTAAGMDIHGWTEGLLVIQDMRLADFLTEVARYRPGHLGWDDDVAELRISGTYPLANTTRVLALL